MKVYLYLVPNVKYCKHKLLYNPQSSGPRIKSISKGLRSIYIFFLQIPNQYRIHIHLRKKFNPFSKAWSNHYLFIVSFPWSHSKIWTDTHTNEIPVLTNVWDFHSAIIDLIPNPKNVMEVKYLMNLKVKSDLFRVLCYSL